MPYVAWGVVLFFAISWTIGLLFRPETRFLSTVAAVIHWWIMIGVTAFSATKVWHLFWLMPLALIVCMVAMGALVSVGNRKPSAVFAAAIWILWPATWLAYQFSK